MKIDETLKAQDLVSATDRVFSLAGEKARHIERAWDPARGAPVYTVRGQYTTRGWTEWTEGFRYGCALLAYDATDEEDLLEIGRRRTHERMASHITHIGVHDHGFNNLSTYGQLRRLAKEGRIRADEGEMKFYDLALMASGAVQAARWSYAAPQGGDESTTGSYGYMHTFNGPHSLFIDTIRTTRILVLADQLGHVLKGEHDEPISLLGRAIRHNLTTARYNIYYGEGRDSYDTPEKRGRTAHETIFNRNDGRFRCPSTQQGYSPFSTWTRGLSWAVLGFAEELQHLETAEPQHVKNACGLTKGEVRRVHEQAAQATADFFIEQATATDGVCYWDTGAPGLADLGDWRNRPADPYNAHEPVDSTAAAITAQGLLRLGSYLGSAGQRYTQAGLTTARTLFEEPYLSTDPEHQGLLLHSIYHRPNGWDHIPEGQQVPCGESSMWGDYHMLELAHWIRRVGRGEEEPVFFDR
jgi:hypothetical protein